MPSASVLEQKKQIVASVADRISNSCAGVIVDYKGISVADAGDKLKAAIDECLKN